MKLYTANIRDSKKYTSFFCTLLTPLLFFSMGISQPASAQQPDSPVPVASSPLSTEQIVDNLVGMNLERAQALHTYHATRIYRVKYSGFLGSRAAEMVVDVKYQSPGMKEFTIQSATGSKLILDKVFKRLLKAEKSALNMDVQKRTALNEDNYDFALIGYERLSSGPAYVLRARPKRNDNFLYSGRIWVDAGDFAVVRIEAEPAKSPSFWTKDSEIEQVYMKMGDFWLPKRNQSVTEIRFGGRAELTIQYKDYQITSASPVSNVGRMQPSQSAEVLRAQR